jgi:hypothetical protein
MPILFRFFCTTILLFSCIIESNAQAVQKETGLHSITLRFNPLSFLETDGNVTIGAGYQWHRRWAITIDPGYIFFSPYADVNNSVSLSGIKIRSDIRFLFDKSRPGGFSSFIAPEFHYKYVSSKKWDDFGINCLGGQCAYYQRAEYKEVKKEIGASVKIGTLIPLFNNRWKVELYGGLGIKFKNFEETDLPVGGSFVNQPNRDNLFNNNNENTGYIIIPGGIKIVYHLK